ncbi:MAG: hypothetical protein JXL20_04425 [Deltaproteobacteria bacterium]|nr:hypothetical protein [Deltaproteobacteria bacterium]MBN2783805.1 hypothetical protein [Pontiellaceae bacterium]
MKLEPPIRIALKHIGTAFLAFIIVLLITHLLFPTTAGLIGAAFAIMSGSVLSAAKEAYRAGRTRSTGPDEYRKV